MGEKDLQERLFKFAIDVIKMLRKLKGGSELLVIKPQLIKSVTSSGANYGKLRGLFQGLILLTKSESH